MKRHVKEIYEEEFTSCIGGGQKHICKELEWEGI